jgi:plastocyanin
MALLLAGCTSSPDTIQPENPPETAPPYGGETSATNTTTTEYGNETEPGDETSTSNETAGEADVVIIDNAFEPNETSVAAGGSLVFRNEGQSVHSVTIRGPGGETLSDADVEPAESTTVDFPEAGTYLLRCRYHSSDFQTGQTGVITVT